MSFDAPRHPAQRIAIIGGGISGMAAAYLLAPYHAVTLYEAEPRLGGHARTVLAGKDGTQPVDTGFIVFNYATYPYMTSMFHDLAVPVAKSDMSFGVSIDEGRVEYALTNPNAFFAQRSNILRPQIYHMLADIMRFNARAEGAVSDDDMTIDQLIKDLKLGSWFRDYYLLPFCGAIWSTPPEDIGSFPAESLLKFFRNHALLNTTGQHQWYTVDGGSIEYVRRLEHRLRGLGCAFRTGTPVKSVQRGADGTQVLTDAHAPEQFDQVIFACHSDDALRVLQQPTATETNALGALKYQDNYSVLHSDIKQMPKRKACWSSWVYRSALGATKSQIGVTYWMNKLQNIPENDPIFISLNPTSPVDEDKIYDAVTFRHPVFDGGALKAQAQIDAIQGQNNTWFAGAYMRNGFHEDGFASAVRIAQAMDEVLV